MEEKNSLRKRVLASVIFFAAVLAIAYGLYAFWYINISSADAKKSVVVEADGNIIYVVSLKEDQTLHVQTEYGTNDVRVEDGKVFVEEADCPKQICVNTAPISGVGQTIICLPHRVVVSITSGGVME